MGIYASVSQCVCVGVCVCVCVCAPLCVCVLLSVRGRHPIYRCIVEKESGDGQPCAGHTGAHNGGPCAGNVRRMATHCVCRCVGVLQLLRTLLHTCGGGVSV